MGKGQDQQFHNKPAGQQQEQVDAENGQNAGKQTALGADGKCIINITAFLF